MGKKSCLDLTGRVAVVFGGTSGLGKSIAVGLAEHGADVIPGGRRADLLDGTCGDIEAVGRRTIRQTVDVTDRSSIGQFRDKVLRELGRVDVLVNAAGTTLKKPTVELTDSEWEGLFRVNLTGLLHSCQEFYQPLKESGAGRIINVASLSSYLAFYQVATYSATKAGVLSLTKSLACEWARDGICVNAIAPGVFPTELNSHLLRGTKRGEEILLRTPMARFGEADEVIGAAVLLASNGASFITGHCLAVDGGYLASGVNS
ncbi:MAG: SDR family NAD(P)-dependent oxidoreductase [Bryobacteraceae bacterium]